MEGKVVKHLQEAFVTLHQGHEPRVSFCQNCWELDNVCGACQRSLKLCFPMQLVDSRLRLCPSLGAGFSISYQIHFQTFRLVIFETSEGGQTLLGWACGGWRWSRDIGNALQHFLLDLPTPFAVSVSIILVSQLHSPSCPVDGNDVLKTLLHPYFDRRKYWIHNHDVLGSQGLYTTDSFLLIFTF